MLFTSLLAFILLNTQLSDNKTANSRSIIQSTPINTPIIIEKINKKVASIDSKISDYKEVEKSLNNQSSEGGLMVAYYDGILLRKIKTTFYGEMGKVVSEYYLNEHGLLFIKKTWFHYDQPMYLEDYKITLLEEGLYYFCDGNLVLWRVFKDRFVDSNSQRFEDEKQFLLKDIKKLQGTLKEH